MINTVRGGSSLPPFILCLLLMKSSSRNLYDQVKYYLCYSTDSSEIRTFEDYDKAFTYSQWIGEATGRVITVEAVY